MVLKAGEEIRRKNLSFLKIHPVLLGGNIACYLNVLSLSERRSERRSDVPTPKFILSSRFEQTNADCRHGELLFLLQEHHKIDERRAVYRSGGVAFVTAIKSTDMCCRDNLAFVGVWTGRVGGLSISNDR